jgi:hypothetical protein
MGGRIDSMTHEHVGIAVKDAATPGIEQVPARPIGENEWELVRSPLYATEVAAGDVIRISNRETGEFEVVTRGGNVCVQFYLGETDADNSQMTIEVAKTIARDIEAFGGVMDAYTPGLIAFTIPVHVGFPAIEAVFLAAADRYHGQWQYANVYDSTTGESLGWWK